MAIYLNSDTQLATEVILRECAGAGGCVGARALRARGRAGRRGNHQRDPSSHAGLGPRHARGAAEPGRIRRPQVRHPRLRGPDLRRPRLRDRRTGVDRRRLARHARRPAARRAAVRRVAVAASDDAARGSRAAGDRPRDARRRGARIALSHQRHRRFRVRSHFAIARRLLPARRRVATRRSQRPASPHRREDRCAAA